MVRSIQVVFVLQHEIHRKAAASGLELVVEDEIGIQKLREEVYFPCSIREGGVRETLRSVNASGKGWQVKSRGTTGTFAGDVAIVCRTGSGCCGLDCEGRRIQNRIYVPPVEDRERRRSGHKAEVQLA